MKSRIKNVNITVAMNWLPLSSSSEDNRQNLFVKFLYFLIDEFLILLCFMLSSFSLIILVLLKVYGWMLCQRSRQGFYPIEHGNEGWMQSWYEDRIGDWLLTFGVV